MTYPLFYVHADYYDRLMSTGTASTYLIEFTWKLLVLYKMNVNLMLSDENFMISTQKNYAVSI